MKKLILPIGLAAVLIAACGKKEAAVPAAEATPAPAAPATTATAPAQAQPAAAQPAAAAATTEQPKQ